MNKDRIDIFKRSEFLNRPLILDGANGSLLQQKNIPLHNNLWSSIVNITHPEEVLKIHKEYIDAGAEIVTTNTFRTNPNAVRNSNLNITNEEFIRCGVQLAIKSAENYIGIIIAGSNPPAEDCYQVERSIPVNKLEYNHKLQIEQLWENGCDIIWNETQSHWDELKIISTFCSENGYPFVINLYFSDELTILSGEPLNEAVSYISGFSPKAIGFNCIRPELLKKYFENYSPPDNWGFYFNCGHDSPAGQIIDCAVDSHDYAEEVKPLLDLKPLFAGSCCGSNPDHTKAIKRLFDEVY